ncbi:uncharacterized protein LOC142226685 [Haematobia irritans]|uniref:uncharacterized protein LOC142226685 n=1 Tax=Haematobia irritans TaxID=7368 RepID=UPI003F5040AD
MIDDFKLMELVEAHEVLYKRRHPDYKNAEKKDEAFMEIANDLGVNDIQLVVNRYRTLRDRYARYNRIKETTGEIRFYIPILDKMEFLGPHIFNRRRDKHSKSDLYESDDDSQDPLNLETIDTTSDMPSGTDTKSAQLFSKRGQKRKSDDTNIYKLNKAKFLKSANEFNETINNFLMVNKDDGKNRGALQGFRQMIISTIAEMSVTKQTKAMLGVTEAVMKIKMEDED